jgi:DNA helicase-2/ATP-dependent DNA helicase PcrA
MTPPEQDLSSLNPAQREAVTHPGGALLVLAGAGSGKTRVIAHRIAWLVRERGVDPSGIIAVTFTNKAAREMRSRVEAILGTEAGGPWIGTFHGLGLRMLRRNADLAGLPREFVVYDADDQAALVRRLLREHDVDDQAGSARSFLSKISRAKNAMESPEAFEKRAFSPDAKLVAEIYAGYEAGLARAGAIDFDDILLKSLPLAERYAPRTHHLLVDEYQDTNRPQYLMAKGLSSVHGNVSVVGDEDQSIYRFRGAEIKNILDFERDHPGAAVVKLEQNYRSTGIILEAASTVIANNAARKGKVLWTENPKGTRIEVHHAIDDRGEAAWIARRASEAGRARPLEDVAVLYRTNAQSRSIEEAFRRERIPYQLVGAQQFYERKEVKDVLSYLRLALNPGDDVSFRRIVNVPTRGLGDTTVDAVAAEARAQGIPLLAAARDMAAKGTLAGRATKALQAFLDIMDALATRAAAEPAAIVIEGVLDAVAYEAYLEKSYPGEGADRMDNVRALVSAAVEYERETDTPTLLGFLDRSALVSEADNVGSRPGVTLMTIHLAKGLEFPIVILPGMEENVFPHSRSRDVPDELEEERRLCYVAITRARERLYLSRAMTRLQAGVPMTNMPSRFLQEIPDSLVEETGSHAGVTTWDMSGSSAARAAYRRPAETRPSRPAPRPTDMPKEADGFNVGVKVSHPMFGRGQVLDREGSGKNLKLTIQFTGHGTKRILPAYTQLEVVGGA